MASKNRQCPQRHKQSREVSSPGPYRKFMKNANPFNVGPARRLAVCATSTIPTARVVRTKFVRQPRYALVSAIRRLFGEEAKSFDLLEVLAREALNGVRLLATCLRRPDQLKTLDEFVAIRRRSKAINNEINEALCTQLFPRWEPEDIAALASAFFKIAKTAEKIAEHLSVAPPGLKTAELAKQVPFIEKAAETVVEMLRELRQGMNPERIGTRQSQLQDLEGEADKVLAGLLRGLYSDGQRTVQLIFLKELFELQERVVDRCRDAGNVITSIVFKSF